jgi:hypothetical protein
MLVYARQNGTAYVAASEPQLRQHLTDMAESRGDGQPSLFTEIERLECLDDLAGATVREVGSIEYENKVCPQCDMFTLHHGFCLRCGI